MQEYITLTRLLQRIRGAVADNFPVPVWVRAEIHELKMHNNGHCYLELVEKGVRVQYSEVYGMSLSIEDIDPAFTLGEVELARQRWCGCSIRRSTG